MEKLGKIFGGILKVKIMRLFLFNRENAFSLDEIIQRTLAKKQEVKKEIRALEKIGFLKKRKMVREKKSLDAWILQKKCKIADSLQSLLLNFELFNEKEILSRFKKTGSMKLILLSGFFLKDEDTKIDLLIVGDKIKKNLLEREIKKIEAEMGKELSYVIFDTEEFFYRIDMYDKLLREIMEHKKYIILSKLNKSIF